MDVMEHQTLEMKNVLSYRSTMSQQELAKKSQEIEQQLERIGAIKAGPVVTTTFSVEQRGQEEPVMDIEILIPLEKEVSDLAGCTWKPKFLLTNALMIKHIGNPSAMQNTINTLNRYITEHNLIPISSGYNVTVKEARTHLEFDQMEVDIYVGISPNIL